MSITRRWLLALTAAAAMVGAGGWLPGRLAGGLAAQTAPRRLAIAAASDLQAILPTLVERFQQQTGVVATVSLGSSGNFFAQIQNGAPFDVFLSADIDYPRQLISGGHADSASLYPYATGRLVLWTRTDTGLDVSRGLGVVRDTRVRRIAIANPAHAPYGRAAVAALRQARLYEAVKNKLVLGENISQAAQFAESGNADVGLIALSLARGRALSVSGRFAEIPASAHPPIEQAAVAITRSRDGATARAFIAFLRRPDTIALFERSGFGPPPAPAARR